MSINLEKATSLNKHLSRVKRRLRLQRLASLQRLSVSPKWSSDNSPWQASRSNKWLYYHGLIKLYLTRWKPLGALNHRVTYWQLDLQTQFKMSSIKGNLSSPIKFANLLQNRNLNHLTRDFNRCKHARNWSFKTKIFATTTHSEKPPKYTWIKNPNQSSQQSRASCPVKAVRMATAR